MSQIPPTQLLSAAQQYLKLGQPARAIEVLQRAVIVAPGSFAVQSLLGIAYHTAGDNENAITHLRAAVTLLPSWMEGRTRLGTALAGRGQYEPASQEFREVVRRNPQNFEALNDLGTVLKSLSRFDEAIVYLRQAVALQPDRAEIHNNLGNALLEAGETVEALAELQHAVSMRPDYVELYQGLGNSLVSIGKIPEAIDSFRRALQINPKHHQMHSSLLMSMHYTDLANENPQAIIDESRNYDHLHIANLQRPASYSNDRDPDRRLRIGYFSPDFRQHSVAYFFEPLLANHDPSIVETFCYADVSTPDAVTARLQKHASQWRSVVGQSDAQIAEQIQLDQIDILVDLAGHTGGGRLTLFGRKPAPVQATYLGYPDSTGVSTVDYRITDSIADPPDASPLGTTENLIRLACPFLTFLPPADSPDLSPLPALQSEYITFGSFNALPKLTTGTIDLWSAVMNAVPQSRMMIKARGLQHAEIANRLAAQFATHGIERDRLTFLGHEKTTGSHLARYHQIDIALDAFPYHGTTTTCEALWMGVPVITLTGQIHSARVGASLLTAINHTEWIAKTKSEFIKIAAELAANQTKLTEIRAALRHQFLSSPLTDAASLAHRLETAYQTMWQDFLK